ncbi:multidrug efflux MFS transporter [Planctomonas sp. JC2975]|uniref:MDR family MFS transporter n=1 Tax=Planctomonas sp. JC2975 TaxID=2729626 RepID=UPI001474F623|nr:MDR family MFS transporter [Planctomonas sp. JC2975]NNC12640.1 multidrug efflux MFS transporter [Planctomonas sp. JC2975]
MSTATHSDPAPAPGADRELKRTTTALVVGVLAVVFDTTIMSVALHTLSIDLKVPVSTIQWVTTGYVLALAATVPLSAWVQRLLGGKRAWMLALTLFLVGSILCSLAWDAPSLIAFRVVQGVGGGLMLPLLQTIVMQAAGGKNLGRLAATVGLPAMLGPILGPAVGGIILNWLPWQWIFWVNVPFCVVGLFLAWRMLPRDAARTSRARLDVVGMILLLPSLVALLLGLSNSAGSDGFAATDAWLPLAIGGALLVAFVVYALARGDKALVDIRLFRKRSVWSASSLLFLSGLAAYGIMLLLPLYLQQLRGADVLAAGLFLIPQGVGTLASRSLAGRLTDAIGARWVGVVGFAIVGLATIPFAFSTATTNEWYLMAMLFVRGFGLGAVVMPLMVASFVGLDKADIPHSSIITRTAQQLGGSFGTAVLAVILQSALVAHASQGTNGVATAYDQAFWWSIGFTAVASVLSFTLPGRQRTAEPLAVVASETGPSKLATEPAG